VIYGEMKIAEMIYSQNARHAVKGGRWKARAWGMGHENGNRNELGPYVLLFHAMGLYEIPKFPELQRTKKK